MIAITTRSSINVKPRLRILGSLGCKVRAGRKTSSPIEANDLGPTSGAPAHGGSPRTMNSGLPWTRPGTRQDRLPESVPQSDSEDRSDARASGGRGARIDFAGRMKEGLRTDGSPNGGLATLGEMDRRDGRVRRLGKVGTHSTRMSLSMSRGVCPPRRWIVKELPANFMAQPGFRPCLTSSNAWRPVPRSFLPQDCEGPSVTTTLPGSTRLQESIHSMNLYISKIYIVQQAWDTTGIRGGSIEMIFRAV